MDSVCVGMTNKDNPHLTLVVKPLARLTRYSNNAPPARPPASSVEADILSIQNGTPRVTTCTHPNPTPFIDVAGGNTLDSGMIDVNCVGDHGRRGIALAAEPQAPSRCRRCRD